MSQTILQTVTLESETCCSCGIPFAIPDYMKKRLMEQGGDFYCPNGHGQHYTKSENQRLREKLDEQMRESTRQAERAYKAELNVKKTTAKLNRINKRVFAGVCPCCNRTFQQLARHMKTKHPEIAA